MITYITDLLDFSDWKYKEIKDVTPLTDEELSEMESLLTNSIDDISQLDHVRMVITYKMKIKELSK